MDSTTRVLAITAVIGTMLTLLTIIGGGWYALAELKASNARLADRIEHLDDRIEQLADTVERNHRELQHSLGNHHHNETGDAVFTVGTSAHRASTRR